MCLRPLATLRWQTTSVRIALCASTMWRCIAAHAMMCSVPAFMCSMTSMRQETCQPMHNNMTPVIQCRDPGSNWGPSDLRSDALPTELSRLRMAFTHGNIVGCGLPQCPAHLPSWLEQLARLRRVHRVVFGTLVLRMGVHTRTLTSLCACPAAHPPTTSHSHTPALPAHTASAHASAPCQLGGVCPPGTGVCSECSE